MSLGLSAAQVLGLACYRAESAQVGKEVLAYGRGVPPAEMMSCPACFWAEGMFCPRVSHSKRADLKASGLE